MLLLSQSLPPKLSWSVSSHPTIELIVTCVELSFKWFININSIPIMPWLSISDKEQLCFSAQRCTEIEWKLFHQLVFHFVPIWNKKAQKKDSHRPFLSFLYLIFKNFIILTNYKYSYRLLTWPAIAWAFSVVLFLLVLWAPAVLLWPQPMCLHHAVLSMNLLWLQVSLPFPPDVWKEQEIPL